MVFYSFALSTERQQSSEMTKMGIMPFDGAPIHFICGQPFSVSRFASRMDKSTVNAGMEPGTLIESRLLAQYALRSGTEIFIHTL